MQLPGSGARGMDCSVLVDIGDAVAAGPAGFGGEIYFVSDELAAVPLGAGLILTQCGVNWPPAARRPGAAR